MCKWGDRTKVKVIRRANPFVKDGWHEISVDSCMAPFVQKLNNDGVVTLQCCCGHGKYEAEIWIAEGSIKKAKSLGYKLSKLENPKRTVIITQ